MKVVKENLEYLIENHKEIYEAYTNFGKLIHEKGGSLDEKTRCLLKIVISATSSHQYALNTHIEKAIKAGVTNDEIEHAILLTAPTAGFPNMMEALLVLRNTLTDE